MSTAATGRRRWITDHHPEDAEYWQRRGRELARRNLVASVFSEHVGFSVWSIWSVLALFLTAGRARFDAQDMFLLVSASTLVGAALRLPYSFAVLCFGGRTWTRISSAVLVIPLCLAGYLVAHPRHPLWVFLLAAGTAGLGGGNFASSMTNVSQLFPRRLQGQALGLNAGAGNLGVAVIQLVGLLVIACTGLRHPGYLVLVYLVPVAFSTFLAGRRMDDVRITGRRPPDLRRALREPHTWTLSLLYLGTFGSFIGYGFAFGVVLHTQFGLSPLRTAASTFAGPLIGSLARPVGGWLADRWGGARIAFGSFAGLAAGTLVLIMATRQESLDWFVAGFILLFAVSGIGNGATYAMIPAVLLRKAEQQIDAEAAGPQRAAGIPGQAGSLIGVVIGVTGAIGCLGGAAINLAFHLSYARSGTGTPAFAVFLVFYAGCMVLVRVRYLRPAPLPARPATTTALQDADV